MSLIEDIKKHEGFSPVTYICPAGYETIGFGQRTKYLKCTKAQAEEWLKQSLKKIEEEVSYRFDWYFKSPQQVKNIVMNMCYQMGISGFSKFKKTIHYLETRQYEKASVEMLDSKWAKKDSPNRAKELSKRLSKTR